MPRVFRFCSAVNVVVLQVKEGCCVRFCGRVSCMPGNKLPMSGQRWEDARGSRCFGRPSSARLSGCSFPRLLSQSPFVGT